MPTHPPDFRETLYTISKDGRRRWVYPQTIHGFWHLRRKIVAWGLLLIYLSLPWIQVDGMQAVLLDIPGRRFTFFGTTLWATDTVYLAFLLAALGAALFFFTALLGRVWCGWACPETVFLEHVFRPIEYLIEGDAAKRRRRDQSPWTAEWVRVKSLKFFIFAALAWLMASTLLAYFIGREPLLSMMTHSPLENWPTFVATLVTMAVVLFQFGWFREQFCTVVCPYARFQSVLLDPHSLVVGYDTHRGEPRGKVRHGEGAGDSKGDCVDCGLCVRVCPTGIDIRNGLQLECIHCANCIDACDSIMTKVGRPLGLIRYDTEVGFARQRSRFLRPRVVLYGLLLSLFVSAIVWRAGNQQAFDVQLIRGSLDAPYSTLDEHTLANHLHLRIGNKTRVEQKYTVELLSLPQAKLVVPISPFPVGAENIATLPLFIQFPPELLGEFGSREIQLRVRDGRGEAQVIYHSLVGPGR